METPPGGFFVARDRARGIGWALERLLQERRLAWRGEAIGMESVADDADRRLAALAEEAAESATAVLEGRIRDRERGYMEMPFAVAMTTVADRLAEAARAEADRRHGQGPAEARRRAEAAMNWALERLAAFQAAYDQQTPVLEARTTDVARLLARMAPEGARPWDRPPLPLRSEPNALADLLLAVASALPDPAGTWQVAPPLPGRPPLQLGWGRLDATVAGLELPPAVDRAAAVLTFRHAVVAEPRGAALPGGEARTLGILLTLGEPVGAGLEATLEMLAGPEARLSPEAEAAARRLFAAPPLGGGPGPPPERLVALVGLERVLEAAVRHALGARLGATRARLAAGALPRERTRRAPVRPAVRVALESAHPGLSAAALGDLARGVARGSLRARDLSLADAALLLAAFGRGVAAGGLRLEPGLDLEPLAPSEVEALVRDLLDVVAGREAVARGEGLPGDVLMRLEGAALGALGRLGRLPSPA